MESNLAYEEPWREELIGGRWVAMAPPSLNHNRIIRNLARLLGNYLEKRRCEVFLDGAGVYLAEGEYYVPDVMVVCDPEKIRPDGVHGAPDLVVEVLSPGTAAYDRGYKREVYEAGGVQEYWLVSPGDKTVEQYVLREGQFRLNETCAIVPDWMRKRMTPRELENLKTKIKCTLCEDLTLSLEDIFAKVT